MFIVLLFFVFEIVKSYQYEIIYIFSTYMWNDNYRKCTIDISLLSKCLVIFLSVIYKNLLCKYTFFK